MGELFQTRGLEEQTCLQPSIADAREDDARCGECGAGCEGRRQGVEHRAKGGRSGQPQGGISLRPGKEDAGSPAAAGSHQRQLGHLPRPDDENALAGGEIGMDQHIAD